MSFLLDTNVCSVHLKRGVLTHKLTQHMGRLFVSSVTVGELLIWGLRAKAPPRRLASIQGLLRGLQQLPFDDAVARRFGKLSADLLDRGLPGPDLDLMIAATAIEHGLTLVTHNAKDFANVPGLTIDDWLAP